MATAKRLCRLRFDRWEMSVENTMTLVTGTKRGPYEILSKLGEVYRARDSRRERNVAIKVLPDRFARDHDALARFRRESKAVAALSHPNIRAIHDIGMDAGRAFAVMELLEGETPANRLKRSAFEWGTAVPIALAVAEGLGRRLTLQRSPMHAGMRQAHGGASLGHATLREPHRLADGMANGTPISMAALRLAMPPSRMSRDRPGVTVKRKQRR